MVGSTETQPVGQWLQAWWVGDQAALDRLAWCDNQPQTLTARLNLFRDFCGGLQASGASTHLHHHQCLIVLRRDGA